MPGHQRIRLFVYLVLLLGVGPAVHGTYGSYASAQRSLEAFDPPRGDQRIVVFGDFNGPYGSLSYPVPVARVLAAVTAVWLPDLLLSPGDVIAGQSRSLSAERLRGMWQVFDQQVAAPLRAADVPYAFAVGNHDASSLTSQGRFLFEADRAAAAEYWGQAMYDANLAYVERREHPFEYSFRAGELFVAVIDASSATVTTEQRERLANTLASAAARGAKARVVVGHLPLLAVGEGKQGQGEMVAAGEQLRLLMEAGNVDLYVSGHHAAYYPGRSGELELLFAGGVGGRRLLGDDRPARSTVTVVDIWYEPLQMVYTTFDAATLEVLPPELLPAELASGVRLSARANPAVAGAPR